MPLQLPNESARSVRLEMVYCPSGPDTAPDLGKYCRTLAWGSSFIYELDGHTEIVTARHNFTGRHWQTNACLGAYPISPTHVRFAILNQPPAEGWTISPSDLGPHVGATAIPAKEFLVSLIGEDWSPIWRQHPTFGTDMDVAVLRVDLSDNDLLVAPWTLPVGVVRKPDEPGWPNLSAGQDVFIVGYPDALTTGPLFPLWIRGTIASEPYFGYRVADRDLPLMLVDARTRRGQSGSAVMRHRAEGSFVRRVDGVPALTVGSHSQIIGVYSGRTSDESDLGYVWRIDEVNLICREGVQGTD